MTPKKSLAPLAQVCHDDGMETTAEAATFFVSRNGHAGPDVTTLYRYNDPLNADAIDGLRAIIEVGTRAAKWIW